MKSLCLASASPRRRELLAMILPKFTAHAVNILEERQSNERPTDYVARLAYEKAAAGLVAVPDTDCILGSDTIVTKGKEVFEKPESFDHFYTMMRLLSGQKHTVMTAVTLLSRSKREWSCTVKTDVKFRTLSESDINWYWNTNEPLDKAGGYGIQGLGGRFVKAIDGSYSAVVGLPLCETEDLLTKAGLLGA